MGVCVHAPGCASAWVCVGVCVYLCVCVCVNVLVRVCGNVPVCVRVFHVERREYAIVNTKNLF